MQIPETFPGPKWLFIFWGATAVFWTLLEGDVGRVQLFGLFTAFVGAIYLFQRLLAGRRLSPWRGLALLALCGLACGIAAVFLTILLMIVKTGIHAHGPEYSASEINMVWQQLPLWGLVGLLAGLGVGLLLLSRSRAIT